MKTFLFAITALFFSFLNAAELVDLFKVSYENNRQVLFFKSTENPEIVKNGTNLSLLFSGNSFAEERKFQDELTKESVVKRILAKNYPEKGGAVNIIGKSVLNADIIRISPDVVKVELYKSTIQADMPKIVPETAAAKIEVKDEKKAENIEQNNLKKENAQPAPALTAKKETVKTESAQKEEVAQTENVTKEETVSADKNETASIKEEKSAKNDFMAALESKEEKSAAGTNDKIMLVMAILVLSAGAILFFKKKSGKKFGAESSILGIVETLQLGLKEKLMLVNVAGNYILLFVREKDVKELAVFKGDDAEDIRRELGKTDLTDILTKDIPRHNASEIRNENKISSKIKPFKSRLEQMIAEEEKERKSTSSIEEDVFSAISKLKAIKVR